MADLLGLGRYAIEAEQQDKTGKPESGLSLALSGIRSGCEKK
jgi:hypothetical protein